MAARVITGIVGIGLFVGVCFWGVTPFGIGATVLAAIALWELHRAFRAMNIRPNLLLSVLGLAAPILFSIPRAPESGATGFLPPRVPRLRLEITMPAMPELPFMRRPAESRGRFTPSIRPVWAAPAVVALFLLALCWEVLAAARSGALRVAQNVGAGLLCGAYVALFAGLVWLRTQRVGASDCGLVLLVALCVWADDSFAFFVGRVQGKHRLAPALSPAKSVEGFLGGLAAAAIVGAAGGQLLIQRPLIGFCVGLIAGLLGPLGDLFESAIKRELGVKDLGAIMPGHGGVLDRFDSLLFVAPAVAAFLSITRLL